MIDLNKLKAKFDSFFENDTEENFNSWLEEKKKTEIKNTILGTGTIETISQTQSAIVVQHCSIIAGKDISYSLEVLPSYSNAA